MGALILLLFGGGEAVVVVTGVGLEHDASLVLGRLHHRAELAIGGPLHHDADEQVIERLDHRLVER